ncbi:hypothetical protein TREMEDRAFT_59244 [Tremella mesenterica DSM 1558]|uniref:uncharacterized protein n=1 Tax=Tremella mesenterica (strain ATCC 24925 / CBS 8224 / DSM 1558 / NBRC 9311 / NRRL Y-6157 / RJB 2259-6 / UBC 559-6) TaxID=578456 RepID=UPI0003F49125|nr:uncharacterized protein TREMEDRAFT_59244 [Tremella mesenterica DSM 1558]EIW73082.1 hypothetical protein TREMEDRAFT_59244 [Tremella mesenterica DSM 1558]
MSVDTRTALSASTFQPIEPSVTSTSPRTTRPSSGRTSKQPSERKDPGWAHYLRSRLTEGTMTNLSTLYAILGDENTKGKNQEDKTRLLKLTNSALAIQNHEKYPDYSKRYSAITPTTLNEPLTSLHGTLLGELEGMNEEDRAQAMKALSSVPRSLYPQTTKEETATGTVPGRTGRNTGDTLTRPTKPKTKRGVSFAVGTAGGTDTEEATTRTPVTREQTIEPSVEEDITQSPTTTAAPKPLKPALKRTQSTRDLTGDSRPKTSTRTRPTTNPETTAPQTTSPSTSVLPITTDIDPKWLKTSRSHFITYAGNYGFDPNPEKYQHPATGQTGWETTKGGKSKWRTTHAFNDGAYTQRQVVWEDKDDEEPEIAVTIRWERDGRATFVAEWYTEADLSDASEDKLYANFEKTVQKYFPRGLRWADLPDMGEGFTFAQGGKVDWKQVATEVAENRRSTRTTRTRRR